MVKKIIQFLAVTALAITLWFTVHWFAGVVLGFFALGILLSNPSKSYSSYTNRKRRKSKRGSSYHHHGGSGGSYDTGCYTDSGCGGDSGCGSGCGGGGD